MKNYSIKNYFYKAIDKEVGAIAIKHETERHHVGNILARFLGM